MDTPRLVDDRLAALEGEAELSVWHDDPVARSGEDVLVGQALRPLDRDARVRDEVSPLEEKVPLAVDDDRNDLATRHSDNIHRPEADQWLVDATEGRVRHLQGDVVDEVDADVEESRAAVERAERYHARRHADDGDGADLNDVVIDGRRPDVFQAGLKDEMQPRIEHDRLTLDGAKAEGAGRYTHERYRAVLKKVAVGQGSIADILKGRVVDEVQADPK
mmetsp:Transcript_1106/g.3156  ORF Transcript_1106/g.3156 Transcript_1106/m.3156 type:complete len:219 (+) Transcript_1106:1185-1841(+)